VTARFLAPAATVALLFIAHTASAQQTITLDGEVDPGEPDHVRVPFDVPEGIVEIEVAHDDLSEDDILDWGLEDPNGFRGWGGGNVEPAIVGVDAASRSYLPGPIGAGTWNVVIGKAKIANPPAHYAITVTLRDTATLPTQTERQPYAPAAPLDEEERWYAGDFHVHSTESGDASATMDEILDLAASRGLDFVVLTEHNTVSHLDFYADVQARHPDVLLVPGIEVTTYDGHMGAFGATSFVEHKIGLDGATIEATAESVHDQGALLSINHPAFDLGDLCIGCAWGHDLAPDHVDGIEIVTAGSASIFLEPSIATWEALLDSGRHVAALGGSDDHRAGMDLGPLQTPVGSPTTMVYATELSVAAILDGIRSGRTVVKVDGPDDPMVELTTDPPLDGDTVAAAVARVRVTVTGGSGQTLRLVDSDGELASVAIDEDPFAFEHEVTSPSRVRAEVASEASTSAVTSHVWVEPGSAMPAGSDGDGDCGCRVPGSPSPRTPWLFALLLLGPLARLRASGRGWTSPVQRGTRRP
jgi:hypothetical protein